MNLTLRFNVTFTFVVFATFFGQCFPMLAQNDSKSKPLFAYVGTFSSPLQDVPDTQVDLPPGNGRGIHIFRVDRQSGVWTAAGVQRMGNSPSCLAVSSDGTRLYSANETDRAGDDKKQGTISSFSINRSTGKLTLINTVASGGAGPTYVSIHPSKKFLLVANYFGGTVSVLPIAENGSLGPASDIKAPRAKLGPTKATHAPPGSFAISGHDHTHAHMIESDPSGKYVIHVDLGVDRIYLWRFDFANGKLVANATPFVSLPPGDGPRHFHFHPNGRWFYSIQEEGSTVVLFDFAPADGTLTARQTISTLPEKFTGSNFCSEILVSDDGRFLYAGNRLHDSIAIFSIGAKGKLVYQGETWTQGNYPRSFSFDPTGRFLYCCNQRSDNIAGFKVDRKSGKLNFSGQFVPVGNPSHIVFLDTEKK